jgi:chromate reductase, NAD(P)H dehydrogenase (quinone)
MSSTPVRVLVFAGAVRKGSNNRKFAAIAAARAAKAGAEVDHLDFTEVAMPVYDGDIEEVSGLPPGAVELRRRIADAQALIISSPEYNASIPGALKNALDWASRPPSRPFAKKVALLLAASPGALGGIRMLPELRRVLSGLGVMVISPQIALGRANEAFDEAGELTNPHTSKDLDNAVAELLTVTRKLAAP